MELNEYGVGFLRMNFPLISPGNAQPLLAEHKGTFPCALLWELLSELLFLPAKEIILGVLPWLFEVGTELPQDMPKFLGSNVQGAAAFPSRGRNSWIGMHSVLRVSRITGKLRDSKEIHGAFENHSQFLALTRGNYICLW